MMAEKEVKTLLEWNEVIERIKNIIKNGEAEEIEIYDYFDAKTMNLIKFVVKIDDREQYVVTCSCLLNDINDKKIIHPYKAIVREQYRVLNEAIKKAIKKLKLNYCSYCNSCGVSIFKRLGNKYFWIAFTDVCLEGEVIGEDKQYKIKKHTIILKNYKFIPTIIDKSVFKNVKKLEKLVNEYLQKNSSKPLESD